MSDFLNADQIMAKIKKGAAEGIAEGARAIEATAVARAPFRDGDLRNSANTQPVPGSEGLAQAVSFNIVYARRQHEETTWNHPRGGQAKYLESAMDDLAPTVKMVLANHLRGVL